MAPQEFNSCNSTAGDLCPRDTVDTVGCVLWGHSRGYVLWRGHSRGYVLWGHSRGYVLWGHSRGYVLWGHSRGYVLWGHSRGYVLWGHSRGYVLWGHSRGYVLWGHSRGYVLWGHSRGYVLWGPSYIHSTISNQDTFLFTIVTYCTVLGVDSTSCRKECFVFTLMCLFFFITRDDNNKHKK